MTVLFSQPHLTVVDYACTRRATDPSFEEVHESHSLSFVRRGSFGCRTHGRQFELSPGGYFIGYPDDPFVCTHEHHDLGDECLSFQFSAELADELGGGEHAWRRVAIPPVAALAVCGSMAQSVAAGDIDWGLDEAGIWLAARFVDLARGEPRRALAVSARDRGRCAWAALWLDSHCAEPVRLADAARVAGISPFHFLRMFARVIETTPHQYVVACRLRRAAALLARTDLSVTEIALEVGFEDLSNFVRTFCRAAGEWPGRYRRLSRTRRKILQVRRAAPAPV
jgi:AraC family transcriptional regulator